MSWWLVVFLVLVTAMLGREVVLLIEQRRGRVIDLTHGAERVRRKIVGLRLLAGLALAMAIGQHNAHERGWGQEYTDLLTAVLLVLAVFVVLAAWRLQRSHEP